jgi:hypothetical protein
MQANALFHGPGYNVDMSPSPSTQRLRAWIALAAFVFGLLAPALSHAFAPPRLPAQAAEICTAAGMVMMQLADSPGKDGGASGDMVHCDMCCSHAAPPLLPAPPGLPPLVVAGRASHPPLFYQSPSPQYAWTPAQSRAPPADFS